MTFPNNDDMPIIEPDDRPAYPFDEDDMIDRPEEADEQLPHWLYTLLYQPLANWLRAAVSLGLHSPILAVCSLPLVDLSGEDLAVLADKLDLSLTVRRAGVQPLLLPGDRPVPGRLIVYIGAAAGTTEPRAAETDDTHVVHLLIWQCDEPIPSAWRSGPHFDWRCSNRAVRAQLIDAFWRSLCPPTHRNARIDWQLRLAAVLAQADADQVPPAVEWFTVCAMEEADWLEAYLQLTDYALAGLCQRHAGLPLTSDDLAEELIYRVLDVLHEYRPRWEREHYSLRFPALDGGKEPTGWLMIRPISVLDSRLLPDNVENVPTVSLRLGLPFPAAGKAHDDLPFRLNAWNGEPTGLPASVSSTPGIGIVLWFTSRFLLSPGLLDLDEPLRQLGKTMQRGVDFLLSSHRGDLS